MDEQIVVFALGAEYFGVDIASVQSIIKMQPITPTPHAPAFVEGITNLRGRVLPVIDLRKRFGMGLGPLDPESRIIVVAAGNTEVGMVVDGVSKVMTISGQMVEGPPSIAASIDTGFITGIAKIDQRLVIMLDLVNILSNQERSDLEGLVPPVI
jgi:purine-binding chemotaxis protein CheW